jgi:hypothetical protein
MEFASNTTTATSRPFHLDLILNTNQNIPFPWKLHEMLDACEKEGVGHIVSWLPDNASFRVHNTVLFMENVIRNFFKQTKYKSFQRQLNIWGFQRILSGPSKGGYSHKYFIRSNESMCCMMSRQKIKGEKRAKPRPYFPFKSMPTYPRKMLVMNNIRNIASIQDQALNILLGKDMFPMISGSNHDVIPFYPNTPVEAPCPVNITSNQINGYCEGSASNFGDNTGTISPCEVKSRALSPRTKGSVSPLTFAEHYIAPLLDSDMNDENMDSNLMLCLSPDPIAPDHPLSMKSQQSKDKSATSFDQVVDDCSSF